MEHINYDPVKELEKFKDSIAYILLDAYNVVDHDALERIATLFLEDKNMFIEAIISRMEDIYGLPKEEEEKNERSKRKVWNC